MLLLDGRSGARKADPEDVSAVVPAQRLVPEELIDCYKRWLKWERRLALTLPFVTRLAIPIIIRTRQVEDVDRVLLCDDQPDDDAQHLGWQVERSALCRRLVRGTSRREVLHA